MADLMIEALNVTTLLKKKYAKLGNGSLTLITLPAEYHMKVNIEALKILINALKFRCVYVTLGKTFTELDPIFKKSGIDTAHLTYIDAISNMYGPTKVETKRCVYVAGPLDIDAITSSLRSLLATLGSDKKCVFLDSVTTVLLYNSLPRTLRFSKFLTTTLKSMGVNGVMVSLAKGQTTESLVQALSKLCDEVIDIGGGGEIRTH